MVVSSDATNELAVITEARKEAKRWNAVENFCKPFDFDDPDKDLTGIAFLIVCDMLLTGFDAPVEQVMYIDKRLREHNLLQAIARVNRVAKGKHRGFIVDYIGLANHLTQALSIYAEEDAQDIQQGLKNLLTELPILEERYQRLLQHFRSAGVAEIEAFVTGTLTTPAGRGCRGTRGSRRDEGHQAPGGLRGLPEEVSPEPEPHSAARCGTSLSRSGPAVRLSAAHGEGALQGRFARHRRRRREGEGAHQRAPHRPGHQSEDSAHRAALRDFMANVRKHAGGDPEAKASEMEHAIRKHCTVHFDEDPAFYKRLSEKLEKLIQEHKNNWEALAEGYEQLRNGGAGGPHGRHRRADQGSDDVLRLRGATRFRSRRCALPGPSSVEGTHAAHCGDSFKRRSTSSTSGRSRSR